MPDFLPTSSKWNAPFSSVTAVLLAVPSLLPHIPALPLSSAALPSSLFSFVFLLWLLCQVSSSPCGLYVHVLWLVLSPYTIFQCSVLLLTDDSFCIYSLTNMPFSKASEFLFLRFNVFSLMLFITRQDHEHNILEIISIQFPLKWILLATHLGVRHLCISGPFGTLLALETSSKLLQPPHQYCAWSF